MISFSRGYKKSALPSVSPYSFPCAGLGRPRVWVMLPVLDFLSPPEGGVGTGGITMPGRVQKLCRCGAWGPGLVMGLVIMG